VPESSSVARKRKPKPTSSRRWKLQRVADRYAHAREDAQLAGLIPTEPEEALRDERVDPAGQSEPPLLGLVRLAVRDNWATPDEKKPVIVDKIVALVEADDTEDHTRIAAARTLLQMDRDQWERDHSELAGKVRGGVQVTNQQQVITGDQLIAMLQQAEAEMGQKIMPPSMLEVELAADQVLPPEITG
jgi:hypothetical protein